MRDLAWACFAPPLIDLDQLPGRPPQLQSSPFELTPERQHWLAQLDAQPQTLEAHLAAQSHRRLGLYFESLWHFFLQQDTQTDLVAHNLPVHEQGRTLGEFDCIYYCHRRRQYCHMELAVKYFLEVRQPAGSHTAYWVGPNTRDRLDLKLRHMLDRQTRLADQPQAQALLASKGIHELTREIALRGYLFQSWAPATASQTPTWLPMNALAPFTRACQSRSYLILPRLRWLSPAQTGPGEHTLDGGALVQAVADAFAGSDRPLLVAALDANGTELTRFFVTPDSWPAQALADLPIEQST